MIFSGSALRFSRFSPQNRVSKRETIACQAWSAPSWLHWNAACAYVHVGRETAVFHHLNQAIAAGFDDWERLHNSPHLATIRETAVWQKFIEQIPQSK